VCNSRRPSFALTEADETNLEVGSGFNKNVKAFKPFNPNAVSFKPFVPSAAPKKEAQPAKTSGLNAIESLSQTKDFTPSTPHVHKFRTELCKNFQLYGTCKYGDEVSTIPMLFQPLENKFKCFSRIVNFLVNWRYIILNQYPNFKYSAHLPMETQE
jgi:hypothetical protein